MKKEEILELIPHRPPILMLDEVLEIKQDYIKALKHIKADEPFFTGHFPQNPTFPGVLIVEALAQAGAVLAYKMGDKTKEEVIYYLAAVDKIKFKKQVKPKTKLYLEVKIISVKGDFIKLSCTATDQENDLVCSAQIVSAKKAVY